MRVSVVCHQCGQQVWKERGAVNRAHAAGFAIYCGRICSGIGRRKNKTLDQKKAEKAAYDVAYREANHDRLLFNKKAYHQRTYDPIKAAAERKKNMPRHVEYCRQPEYRAYKHEYDRRYNVERSYGPFWEAARVLIDLEKLIRVRATHVEARTQNGTLNKTQKRKRDYAQAIQDQSRQSRGRSRV